MPALNLKSLVSKLNPLCRSTLEGAAGLCLSRTNYNVELEHWFTKILESNNTDLHAILKYFEVDPNKLISELTRAMDRFKTGNARPPALSPAVVEAAKDAYLLASVDFNESQARSGHLLLAILSDESSRMQIISSMSELEKINPATLRNDLGKVCKDTEEARQATTTTTTTAPAGTPGKPGGPTKTPSLDQFTIDLTAVARAGKIDPVLGRDDEIRQIIDILCRRRQNNPILTGEAGVGKTAVVEGFAVRIANNDVPPALQGVSVRTLDLALLQAGAGIKGEFENRLKSVIEEVKSSPTPIIMFIDEAHTMIGAGGSAGQGDAANLLKPALARGELRTIAATTWAEYKKYFERDAALARRFQVVKVEEPEIKSAIEMMRGLVSTLEKHHNVRILNEAVEDAVKLSSRYISGRQLPDKSVSLLDTTCARIGLSQNSTPPAIEDARRTIEQLKVSEGILKREMAAGVDHNERLNETVAEREEVEKNLERLLERWEKEKVLVQQINEMHRQLTESESAETAAAATNGDGAVAATNGHNGSDGPGGSDAPGGGGTASAGSATATATATDTATATAVDKQQLQQQVQQAEQELAALQGETPLVHVCCNSNAVAETVGSWTGIPVGRMVSDEIKTIMNLKDLMERDVVGQSHALQQIATSIQMSRAKLTDPSRPIGIFLLAGTSGVGKTETAITLANLLYGGEQNMTTINMSEFKEEHKVSLLMGSPPGYVGYGEGGVLTEAVRRKPYSVLLLDEMEKSHPGVQDVFYQVFDKGHMKDGEGRDIDFKNTVIIMTSNAGTDLIKSLCSDPETMPDHETLGDALHPELLKTFKPAFLGRITILPYFPLSDEVMKKIIRLKLGKVKRRIKENYKASLEYGDDVIDAIAARCTEVDTGARNVDKIMNKSLLPELSGEFLSAMADGKDIKRVAVTIGENGQFEYDLG
jgi:type VI secretion system protein VasG